MRRWLEAVGRRLGMRRPRPAQVPISVLRSAPDRAPASPPTALESIARKVEDGSSVTPLTLVTVTLVALVAAPLTAEWYTRPLFDELRAVTVPAQQLVTRVHVALALEGSALRDYAETSNPALAARFRAAVAADVAAQGDLGRMAEQLGPMVRLRYATLRDAARRWHAAADEVLERADTAATGRAPRMPAPDREELYQEVLTAAARLDEALDGAVHARRGKIRDAVRLQRAVSVGLSGLALLALGAVALVARRLRTSAAEAKEGRQAVEQLMESKARLMRGVTHDIKNPLNAIDGFAALLGEEVKGELTPEQRRCVARIRAGVGTVLALVDDLLELSRAEVGQLHITCESTDLRGLVVDVVEQYRAKARKHSLEVLVADDVPPLDTDPRRVRQVLGNLLSNAIKYTPAGGRIAVEVQVQRIDGSRASEEWVAVHVSDTGPGIPPSQQDAVFDEFIRLDRTGQRGAGLGLAIARRVARLLGGALTLESEVGRGSRFTLWLPAQCRPPQAEEVRAAAAS